MIKLRENHQRTWSCHTRRRRQWGGGEGMTEAVDYRSHIQGKIAWVVFVVAAAVVVVGGF